MEYQATLEIKCGVYYSNKPLRQFQKTEIISADNVNFAHQKVRNRARALVNNYLSSPEEGFTKVSLVSLKDGRGGKVLLPSEISEEGSSMVRLLAMSM